MLLVLWFFLLFVCLFEGLAQCLRCPVVSEEAEGSLHLFFHIVYNEYVSDVTYRVIQPLLLGKEVYNEYVSDVTYRVKQRYCWVRRFIMNTSVT